MMKVQKDLKLVISDAELIIDLARIGKLDMLFRTHFIYLTERLFSMCRCYIDPVEEKKIDLDFRKYIKNKHLVIEKVSLSIIDRSFGRKLIAFQVDNVEMHEGELESIIFAYGRSDLKLCAGSGSAYKFMAFLGLSDRTISLERVLGDIDRLQMKYSELMRKAYLSEGSALKLHNP